MASHPKNSSVSSKIPGVQSWHNSFPNPLGRGNVLIVDIKEGWVSHALYVYASLCWLLNTCMFLQADWQFYKVEPETHISISMGLLVTGAIISVAITVFTSMLAHKSIQSCRSNIQSSIRVSLILPHTVVNIWHHPPSFSGGTTTPEPFIADLVAASSIAIVAIWFVIIGFTWLAALFCCLSVILCATSNKFWKGELS